MTSQKLKEQRQKTMNILKRDGKTFVEVDIPKGEYCLRCIFKHPGYCEATNEWLNNNGKKHKDCPSLKD